MAWYVIAYHSKAVAARPSQGLSAWCCWLVSISGLDVEAARPFEGLSACYQQEVRPREGSLGIKPSGFCGSGALQLGGGEGPPAQERRARYPWHGM